MDFSSFDATEAVLLKTVQMGQGTEERPFVDENPCLLCGHKAFANFIDITLVTSCTSQSSTPVRKKLRDILKKVWVHTKENNVLCLACYDLVDRYDSLEAQLNNIRENIEEKYQKTCAKKQIKMKISNSQKKRGRPKAKSDTKVGTKKKKAIKSEIDSDDDKDYDFSNDTDMAEERGTEDSECSAAENDLITSNQHCSDQPHHQQPQQQQQQQHQHQNQPNSQQKQSQLQQLTKTPVPPAIPVEVIDAVPNLNVYDENHQMLQRGQKMRLGKLINDNGLDMYKCGYCQHTWATIAHLHNHVHSYHMPEVVGVAIPPELGLGNTMNCGIELQNVSEPPECPKPWSCIFCDAAFRARTNISSHFKEKHTPHKPFVCADCGEAFRKGIDLNRHKLYFCPERTITFAPKRKYKKREPKEKPSGKKKSCKSETIDHCE